MRTILPDRLRTVPREGWSTFRGLRMSGGHSETMILAHLSMILRILLQCLDVGLKAIRVIALIHFLERVGRV
jgi:hypothetical protein